MFKLNGRPINLGDFKIQVDGGMQLRAGSPTSWVVLDPNGFMGAVLRGRGPERAFVSTNPAAEPSENMGDLPQMFLPEDAFPLRDQFDPQRNIGKLRLNGMKVMLVVDFAVLDYAPRDQSNTLWTDTASENMKITAVLLEADQPLPSGETHVLAFLSWDNPGGGFNHFGWWGKMVDPVAFKGV